MAQTGNHTPGPWTAEPMEDGCSVAYRITDANGYEIAVTSGRDSEGEEEANARLIAAAPEMLHALYAAEIGIAELCYGQHPDNECWNTLRDIRAAIAKAEGR